MAVVDFVHRDDDIDALIRPHVPGREAIEPLLKVCILPMQRGQSHAYQLIITQTTGYAVTKTSRRAANQRSSKASGARSVRTGNMTSLAPTQESGGKSWPS